MNNADRFHLGRPPQSADHAAEASWGLILYRGATAVAVLILVLAAGNYLYNMSQSRPLIPLIPVIAAGVIWLIGHGARYLLTDR
jgi:hypothetical protein